VSAWKKFRKRKLNPHRFIALTLATIMFLLAGIVQVVVGHLDLGILFLILAAVILAIFSRARFLETPLK
jgi:hypothetical protein